MNQVKKLKQLENLSYFDKNTLSQIIDIADNSLYANVKRWIKNGQIIQFKKGLYVTKSYYDRVVDKDVYIEFVANSLHFPSYLSLEYVLQKYSVLPESIFSVTSITLKTKRIYRNKLGVFIYRKIRKDLFTGFRIRKRIGYEVKEATRAKALFDYLYLKLFRVKEINTETINSFRLNLEEFSMQDKNEFKRYCIQTGVNKYKLLSKLIFMD